MDLVRCTDRGVYFDGGGLVSEAQERYDQSRKDFNAGIRGLVAIAIVTIFASIGLLIVSFNG
jgi:hypothetical protein